MDTTQSKRSGYETIINKNNNSREDMQNIIYESYR